MPLSRRSFLVTGSLAAGALATVKPFAVKAAPMADLQDWSVVRRQFDLDPAYVHLGLFYLTSHPRPVRAAIESYRKLLDANPFPDAPPRYVRLVSYRYRFTTREERAQSGAWWAREFTGFLTRPITLSGTPPPPDSAAPRPPGSLPPRRRRP